MDILFFNVETNGLITKGASWDIDFLDYPFPVQVSWVVLSESKHVLIKENHIIRNDNWDISEESSEIHGIDNDIAKNQGEDMLFVLRHFVLDCLNSDRIVAHNMLFHMSVVAANLLKLGVEESKFEKQIAKEKQTCIMKSSINFMRLTFRNTQGYKYPSFSELYFKLFNGPLEGGHSATSSINATIKCYYRLIELEIIK